MQPLPPGDLSQLELVGSGGFGEVYRGRSTRLGMDIALKKTLRDSAADLKSLLKEKDMMSRANYTYVLRLLGLYEIEGRTTCNFGLVMEYMPYGSICTLFKCVENVPWALRFQILHQVALGMNYLHHVLEPPIIHRDLKPHNVLLNKSLDIQLTDFGLAKNVESDTSSQSMAGTVSYMPPEALKSITYKPTKEFDVYSFAIFIWSVLSAKEPYKGVNREMIELLIPQCQKHRPDMNLVNQWTSQKMVPEAIQLMQECWVADPSKRPLFSAIIKRTDEMNLAYAGEIHNEIIKILDELKKHNSAHFQALDNPDGGRTSSLRPTIPDTYSLSVNNFREILQLAEKRGAHAHNTPVSPESSREDNVDAKDFLESNFPQIVQAKPDLSEVLDVLLSKRTITQEELDTIKLGSIQNQIRKTLHTIISKGQESCMEFLKLLNRLHAELMTSLTSNSLPGDE
ncbi:receptor-interacting serine/threonine-protein kinase 4-like [Hyla sarda]|uniref:receptor-interacting serine/threonine-protein kinase 4-like n=1 Tax=Hyla sarda TaxID=327740 RepID=UPI0024C265DF|nr:receptor-interacting serine/threonine-protein kinase 4-like [Hyla sarda]